jgi:hypothetical protein
VQLLYRRALRRHCLGTFSSLAGLQQTPGELLRLYCRVYKRYRTYFEAVSFIFQPMMLWLRGSHLDVDFLERDGMATTNYHTISTLIIRLAIAIFQNVICSPLNSTVDSALAGPTCHFECSHQQKAKLVRLHLSSGKAELPKLWTSKGLLSPKSAALERHVAVAATQDSPAPVARKGKKPAPASPTTLRTADGQTFNIGNSYVPVFRNTQADSDVGCLAQHSSVLRRLLALGN